MRSPGFAGKVGRPYGSEAVESIEFKGAHDPVHDREVPLRQLRPGDRFELHLSLSGKVFKGTLIAIGPGTAKVVLDGHEAVREVAVKQGKETVIRSMGGPTYWSTGTAVVPLNERADISDFLGSGKIQQKAEAGQMTAQSVGLPGIKTPAKAKAKIKLQRSGPAKQRTPKAPKELHECLCGCGEMVGGRFRMGHDARYHGWLNKLASGMSVEDVNKKSGTAVNRDVLNALKREGGTLKEAAKKLLKVH